MTMNERPMLEPPVAARAAHDGYLVPSETTRSGDEGTAWPADMFTGWVVGDDPAQTWEPAPHSYAGDGNMESYLIAAPYSKPNEAGTDVGAFTGATGPAGHVTLATQPEVTAP